jgi:hypothetical protein
MNEVVYLWKTERVRKKQFCEPVNFLGMFALCIFMVMDTVVYNF